MQLMTQQLCYDLDGVSIPPIDIASWTFGDPYPEPETLTNDLFIGSITNAVVKTFMDGNPYPDASNETDVQACIVSRLFDWIISCEDLGNLEVLLDVESSTTYGVVDHFDVDWGDGGTVESIGGNTNHQYSGAVPTGGWQVTVTAVFNNGQQSQVVWIGSCNPASSDKPECALGVEIQPDGITVIITDNSTDDNGVVQAWMSPNGGNPPVFDMITASPVTYQFLPPYNPPSRTIQMYVEDAEGQSDFCSVTIPVSPTNEPPTCGFDGVLTGAIFEVTDSVAGDPNSTPDIQYNICTAAAPDTVLHNYDNPTIPFQHDFTNDGSGDYIIKQIVSDGVNPPEICSTQITVDIDSELAIAIYCRDNDV